MEYGTVVSGRFLARPNRFIAHVDVAGKPVVAHVKNTGRCKELLLPGARVYLEHAPHPGRKTDYSLIAVEKGDKLINMDSQAPNRVVEEVLRSGWIPTGLAGPIEAIRRETAFGASRLDFSFTAGGVPAFMEVKGVTLEAEGRTYFPDAPTQRGIKHLHHLMEAGAEGYLPLVVFVIQMEGTDSFAPNDGTHPAFGTALRAAAAAGVKVLAWDCAVTPGSIRLGREVAVLL